MKTIKSSAIGIGGWIAMCLAFSVLMFGAWWAKEHVGILILALPALLVWVFRDGFRGRSSPVDGKG